MDVRRGRLGARLEVRLGEKTKAGIERAAKGCGRSVGDYVRGLCLAELGRREGEAGERKGARRGLMGAGIMCLGQGRRKKGV